MPRATRDPSQAGTTNLGANLLESNVSVLDHDVLPLVLLVVSIRLVGLRLMTSLGLLRFNLISWSPLHGTIHCRDLKWEEMRFHRSIDHENPAISDSLSKRSPDERVSSLFNHWLIFYDIFLEFSVRQQP